METMIARSSCCIKKCNCYIHEIMSDIAVIIKAEDANKQRRHFLGAKDGRNRADRRNASKGPKREREKAQVLMMTRSSNTMKEKGRFVLGEGGGWWWENREVHSPNSPDALNLDASNLDTLVLESIRTVYMTPLLNKRLDGFE